MSEFDAFLSYSRRDLDAAVALKEILEARGLRIWFDKDQIQPGDRWIPKVEQGLEGSRSFLFLFGAHGIGPFQEEERYVGLIESVSRGKKLIPILLPTGEKPDDRNLPPLLRGVEYARFEASLSESAVVESLCYAITGRRPAPPEETAARPADTAPAADSLRAQALENLRDELASGPITFFLGPNAAPGGDDEYPPRACEITQRLLADFEEFKGDEPGKGSCFPRNVAGDYFSVRRSESLLASEVVGVIHERSRRVPEVHRRLAALLSTTLARGRRENRRREYLQLIVTTALDLLMERALLEARIPFTRLVVQLPGRRIEVNQYWQAVGSEGEVVLSPEVPAAGDDRLDLFIRDHGRSLFDPDRAPGLSNQHVLGPAGQPIIGELPRLDPAPVLVKFAGSVDLPDTCVLSSEQEMQIATAGVSLPREVQAAIDNTAWLCLGYGLFDPEMRLLCHTALKESRRAPGKRRDVRYAVQPPPADEPFDRLRHLEVPIWQRVRARWAEWRSGTLLESSTESFLDDLIAQVSGAAQ